MRLLRTTLSAAFAILSCAAMAADYPEPRQADWVAKDFIMFGIATAGGTLNYQTLAATGAKADKMTDDRLKAPFVADANDFIYQWEASHDFNPSAGLERIEAAVLAINSADDERNPPETGLMDRELKRIKNARLYLIPASTQTKGHLTTGDAKFYKQQLQDLLQAVPQKTM